MRDWRPTSREWSFLAICLAIWAIVICILPPGFAGIDAYLFRDAACNTLAGGGFSTASFEHSRSFSPLLYSSYAPGSLWAFAGVAKLLGCGPLSARLYPAMLALLADVAALFAGLRFLTRSWSRWGFLILMGLVLPYGLIGPAAERPVAVSFLVLTLLVLTMRQRPRVGPAAAVGLLGGVALLFEPFAGAIAAVLIGGWLLCLGPFCHERAKLRLFVAQSAMAGMLFVFPAVMSAVIFYHEDPESLERFWQQAMTPQVMQPASYPAAEVAGEYMPSGAPSLWQQQFQEYKAALAFRRDPDLICLAGTALSALAWVLLLSTSQGPWPGRLALGVAGMVCFVFPVVFFPQQGSYMALTRVFFPVLLAANWGSARTALRSPALIPVLLVVNVLAVLPATAVTALTGWEERGSYQLALHQAATLRKYLVSHPLDGKVVLVPATHYYLYKEVAGNIYNPDYLSSGEDPEQVGAVVNCYASPQKSQLDTLPLPGFVAGRKWSRLSMARETVLVSSPKDQQTSRNWGCDIYVEPTELSSSTPQARLP